MALGEFDLIERFFRQRAVKHAVASVALGIGDDCALLNLPPGTQLAISCDMLVAGRHFFPDVKPAHLGHKALAVNLSDLAACGAQPLAFTLALSLPAIDEAWLQGFSDGLMALADEHHCALIGGDTTAGPLNICITVFGSVPVPGRKQPSSEPQGNSQALLRSGARAGDDLYVSGTLGDARLALDVLQGRLPLSTTSNAAAPATNGVPSAVFAAARLRLECPTPRVALGLALRGVANSAIDVSDGLLGDLAHILKASGCGACIETDIAIDLLASCQHPAMTDSLFSLNTEQRQDYVLAGGDDYELLFTAPPACSAAVQAAAQSSNTRVTRIGRIEAEPGLRLIDAQGQALNGRFASFDHFG
jgi:thiamine-monophosphate kinase